MRRQLRLVPTDGLSQLGHHIGATLSLGPCLRSLLCCHRWVHTSAAYSVLSSVSTATWVLHLDNLLINLTLIVHDAGVVAIDNCDLSLVGALAGLGSLNLGLVWIARRPTRRVVRLVGRRTV